jgi:hypothetical protein
MDCSPGTRVKQFHDPQPRHPRALRSISDGRATLSPIAPEALEPGRWAGGEPLRVGALGARESCSRARDRMAELFLRLLLNQIPEPAGIRNDQTLDLVVDVQEIFVSRDQDIGLSRQGRGKDQKIVLVAKPN